MTISRRQLVRNASIAGGALCLGINLSACRDTLPLTVGGATDFIANAFLRIGEDNSIVVQIPKAEMGQGVITGVITLIAEELDVVPEAVRFEMAPVHPAFNDPEMRLQITGGSSSLRVYYQPLRQAGAAARAVLLSAAAAQSGIDRGQLKTARGRVLSADGSYNASYGELAAAARSIPVPETVELKPAAQWELIGRFDQRLDAGQKTDGSAVFGIDVQVENSLTAVVVRSPVFGGKLIDFDAAQAIEISGVVDIFPIGEYIAVVAEGYWAARKAADKVDARFQSPEGALRSSEEIERAFASAFEQGDFNTVRNDPSAGGDSGDEPWLEAQYYLPFLAHATMEPQNATAWVRDGRCDLWLGTQSPDIDREAAARVLNLPSEAVTVHNQLLGGGFGRRAMPDSAAEVAAIAARVDGPVKLIWSREDDTRHDYYRPAMAGQLRAQVGEDGRISNWRHRLVGPSVSRGMVQDMGSVALPRWLPNRVLSIAGDVIGRKDSASVEGAAELPYTFDGVQVEYRHVSSPVPLGYWRSVGHSHTAFVVESFVDELAHKAGEDPLAFRLRHLPADSAQSRALEAVARAAGWGSVAAGRFQGIAVHHSFQSTVAQVVEISLREGQAHLEHVYCVVDCGQVINPDIVRDQMESGIVFGLSAALYGEITLDDGAVSQSNFHDYPVLRHNEMPSIHVSILDSDAPPTGVGEPGTPPAAPALANAIFSATGQRLRRLPLKVV